MHELADPDDAEALTQLAGILSRAEAVAASVLDAFRVLWLELPFAADLVSRAERDRHALVDLDAVVELSNAVAAAGATADPSTEAFLLSLDASEGAPSLAAAEADRDEVYVLTAHATAGREFDTVIVLDALEGDFPSLSGPSRCSISARSTASSLAPRSTDGAWPMNGVCSRWSARARAAASSSPRPIRAATSPP